MPGAAKAWIARYVLSLTVVLAMPLIALVMTTMFDGIMPDGPKQDVAAAFPAALASEPHCVGRLTDLEALQHSFDAETVACRCAAAKTVDPRFVIPPESAIEAACLVPSFSALSVSFAWEDAKTFNQKETASADVDARFRFIVPAGLLTVLSFPIMIVSFVMLLRRRHGDIWATIMVVTAVSSAVYGYSFVDVHPLRIFLVELLLGRAAEHPGYAFLTTSVLNFALHAIDYVTAIVMAATASLFVVGASIAGRPPPELLTPANLLHRGQRLQLTVGVGAVVLALTVAAGYGLLHWSSALVVPGDRGVIQSMASSALLYWGVLWSICIAMLAIPTTAALRMDARLLAASGGDTEGAMFKETGLDVTLKRAVSLLLAIAAPALTGPALDLFTKSVGGG